MRFLRENLFLVCTLGAVIVAAAALPLLNMAVDEKIETRKQERQRLAKQISEASVKPVNEDIIQAKRKRLIEVADSQVKVASLCTLWNGRNYQPFLLSFNSVKGPRQIPAFPIDTRTYDQYALWFKVAEIYRGKLNDLRTAMDPVRPLDAKEIDEEAGRIAAARALAAKYAPEPAASQPAATAPETPAAPQQSPQDQAKKMLVKQRAINEGKMIYFDSGALDVVTLPDTTRPTPTQIYQAMLNYWVTSDILTAVKATNDLAAADAKNRGIAKPGVVDAAVKEIVKIDIAEDYSTRAPDSFTLRQTCKDYTVLPYKFQVIMPLSSLHALQDKLMELNYHTVLRVQAKSLPPMDEKTAPPDKYYGTDPVMEVLIQGELLLLADWERGSAADSTLAAADILQWPAFTASLVRQGLSASPSPGKRVWNLLSEGMRKNLTRANAAQDRNLRETLAAELKQILTRNDFYAAAEWKSTPLTPAQQLMADKLDEGRLAGKELEYFNRSLLNAVFPEMIAPPQYLPALVPVEVLEKMPQEALRQQDQDRLSNKTP